MIMRSPSFHLFFGSVDLSVEGWGVLSTGLEPGISSRLAMPLPQHIVWLTISRGLALTSKTSSPGPATSSGPVGRREGAGDNGEPPPR